MSLIEIDRSPTPKDLRWFGLLSAVFFVLLGGLAYWHWPAAAPPVWIAGTVLVGVYAAAPPLRRWIYLGWIHAALPVGWTVSHLMLACMWFLVVTPIGLALRAVGGDPLDRAPDRRTASYWRARREGSGDRRRYFRQF